MKRNRIRLYLIFIGMGLVAVVVDRLVFRASEPTHAQASLALIEDLEADIEEEELPLPAMPFPSSIKSWVGNSFPDSFASPQARGLSPGSDGVAVQGGPQVSALHVQSTRLLFQQNHLLSGLAQVGELGVAIVNGKWVEVGDVVDGCELVGLGESSAKFLCRDGEVELSVMPGGGS